MCSNMERKTDAKRNETKEVIKNQSVVVRVAYCIDFTDRARCLLLKFAESFGFNNGVLS